MTEWGIAPDNQLLLWDWVGALFSLVLYWFSYSPNDWYRWFSAALAGAHAVDEHFQNTGFEQNIPVLMALLGIWNNNF